MTGREIMEELKLEQFADELKPRARDAHKGDFGHVLVIGGDLGFSGAVSMAAEAALRVGAGLVSIATRREHASLLNIRRPEVMCHGVTSFAELEPLLEKTTVIVLGPGLGHSDWSEKIFSGVVQSELPMILDADGLNWLAKKPMKKSNWILTPHPAEAGRLLNQTTQKIQNDREAAVKLLQHQFDGWVVLKGAGSLVAGPNEIKRCTHGSPGMATAGMGDILSGVVGGLAAQKIALGNALKLGVLIHALAGARAAINGERGMIATDLLPYLRKIVNNME